ncbi:hypothetical protein WB334_25900, partial [Escherichia coli]|uniref:hypothetical protein n=1 Tax=Escherichia coli TaxID=562 RepID=UPI0021578EF9
LKQLTEDRRQRVAGPFATDGAASIVSDPTPGGDPGLIATVRPKLGCRILHEENLPDSTRDLAHRVLTDTVFVTSDRADFSYTVEIGELPGA